MIKQMQVKEEKQLSLEEKLKSEVRVCPRCTYEVRDPFLERCPRCYAVVPVTHRGCNGCFHRKFCPVARVF